MYRLSSKIVQQGKTKSTVPNEDRKTSDGCFSCETLQLFDTCFQRSAIPLGNPDSPLRVAILHLRVTKDHPASRPACDALGPTVCVAFSVLHGLEKFFAHNVGHLLVPLRVGVSSACVKFWLVFHGTSEE